MLSDNTYYQQISDMDDIHTTPSFGQKRIYQIPTLAVITIKQITDGNSNLNTDQLMAGS